MNRQDIIYNIEHAKSLLAGSYTSLFNLPVLIETQIKYLELVDTLEEIQKQKNLIADMMVNLGKTKLIYSKPENK